MMPAREAANSDTTIQLQMPKKRKLKAGQKQLATSDLKKQNM